MTNTTRPSQRWTFAQHHPVLTFLLINFGWTWLFWLAAIPFRTRDDLLVRAIVLIGGFGPALAGTVTLGLRSDEGFDLSPKRIGATLISAAIIFAVMVLRYQVGNVPNYQTLADDLTLSMPIVAGALVASLVGGWVIAGAVSGNADVRARMGSMLPRLGSGWTLLALVFYPALILIAWGLASLLGMGVEYPGLWGQPLLDVLPIYALGFVLTALAQGGNEEPGWRGFLQPELQTRFSPLVAALIVAGFWSLWHLPLYLNGFYGGDLVGGMIGGAIFRILLSIFLAWFYNRSNGDLFAMVFLHTCFNVMVNFLPTSDLGLTVLWLLIVIVIVVKDKMYRKPSDNDWSG
jgi:membrane protease YdiL (CAAX protease family)